MRNVHVVAEGCDDNRNHEVDFKLTVGEDGELKVQVFKYNDDLEVVGSVEVRNGAFWHQLRKFMLELGTIKHVLERERAEQGLLLEVPIALN